MRTCAYCIIIYDAQTLHIYIYVVIIIINAYAHHVAYYFAAYMCNKSILNVALYVYCVCIYDAKIQKKKECKNMTHPQRAHSSTHSICVHMNIRTYLARGHMHVHTSHIHTYTHIQNMPHL